MAVKEQVLETLERNRGVYLSGEQLADTLHVSRAAVWKAIRALSENGYSIDAVPNRGYCLSDQTDILSAAGIQKYLSPRAQAVALSAFPTVTSTNTLLKEQAAAGAPEFTVIAASQQTAGKGRRGRSFFSPSGTGAYISILLRPKLPAERATLITTAAAAAMAESIESVSELHPMIKWVNDLFLDGKKVCGILTEASMDMESGSMEYAILGAGVNVYAPEGGFPPEISDLAGCLFPARRSDMLNRLTAAFLNHFLDYYDTLDEGAFLTSYRSRSLALGRRVQVLRPDGSVPAQVLSIDDQCRLLVRYDDGTEGLLSSGEISIRL